MKNAITSIFFSAMFIAAISTTVFANTLPEGKWQLDGYNFKQKIAYPIDKQNITLNITADGKLGGKSGCNVYGGSYKLDDDKLRISDIFSTMMACDEQTMAFEQTYFEVLKTSTEFSLVDGKLTVTDPKTYSFVRFVKAEEINETPKCDQE